MQRLTSAEGWVGSQLLELRREVRGLFRQPLETTPIPSMFGSADGVAADSTSATTSKAPRFGLSGR
jgi:hypothetical protein